MGSGKSGETKRKEMEIASNEKIAAQNLDFQRENLDYQKALQQQIFQREDTNIQRQVSDARAAGVSPLAVSLSGGSAGAEVPTTALNNQMQYDYTSGMSTDVQKAQALVSAIGSVQSLISQTQQLQYNKAQLDSLRLQNSYDEKTLMSRVNSQYTDEVLKNINRASAKDKYWYEHSFGIVPGMSDTEKKILIARKLLGLDGRLNGQVTNVAEATRQDNNKNYYRGPELFEDVYDYNAKNIKSILKDYLKNISGSDDSSKSYYDNELDSLSKLFFGF